MKRAPKPGTIPEPYLAVKNHRGEIIGRVTRAATQSTCKRFGAHAAVLTRNPRGGTMEWRGQKPKPVK